jgi:hypothetical protein
MRFLFQGRDDSIKSFDVRSAEATADGPFERGQVTLDALRQFSSFCRRSYEERAAICFPDFACDQPAPCQSIENTR